MSTPTVKLTTIQKNCFFQYILTTNRFVKWTYENIITNKKVIDSNNQLYYFNKYAEFLKIKGLKGERH